MAAIVVTSCGTGARQGLSVTPASPHPTSTLRFRFAAPEATGRRGQTETGYSLSVAGPQRRGCVGMRGDQLPSVTRDELVTVNVAPAQDQGQWCAGAFTARVQELARPVCAVGAMCPQFVRIVARVGEVRFTIH